jgi:arginyl-tRNA synthetase
VYIELEQRLRAAVVEHLLKTVPELPPMAPETLVVDHPPKLEMGEFALPICFELAKRLRRPPRQLAQELAAAMPLPLGFAKIEAAGGGYLNFYVCRSEAMAALRANRNQLQPRLGAKVIVEHTNINPNKAAHIGHLRNAVLGDTWVRLLRRRGETVEVQNLQDNTGVQVADVVAAFQHLTVPANADARFDYLCWDMYAAMARHYESHPEDLAAWRGETLHAIEAGGNATAALADDIASKIAHCHLRTMDRLGVRYDVLPRESEILQLHLWSHAFALLKERGAVRLETEGKNAGCWVMERVGSLGKEGEEETKVIVRSTGTVTYVGKDIAYQLWKLGLLPLEFGFARFHEYDDGHIAWRTALTSEPRAPRFGGAEWVFNVIDVRQSYLQEIVVAGLRALGFDQQAEQSVHFSYEMVALTAACAAELGYAAEGGEGDGKRVDVSGRKGTGVKADDLIDRLEAQTLEQVRLRHGEEMPESEQREVAHQIAVGALRYFLLKFTCTTLIAFDFKEALSFEGESGPYVQYAAVRAANILRKAGRAPADAVFHNDPQAWNLLWQAGRLEAVVEQALATREPSHLAKYAFQLAQGFNNFYHHTPVLQETDAEKRAFLLQVVALAHRQLAAALELMGIAIPRAM